MSFIWSAQFGNESGARNKVIIYEDKYIAGGRIGGIIYRFAETFVYGFGYKGNLGKVPGGVGCATVFAGIINQEAFKGLPVLDG